MLWGAMTYKSHISLLSVKGTLKQCQDRAENVRTRSVAIPAKRNQCAIPAE